MKKQTEGFADLAPDDRALVRVLRGCDEEIALSIVVLILDAIPAGMINEHSLDLITFEHDVNLLAKIRAGGGFYEKGFTRDTLSALLGSLEAKSREKGGKS